MAWILEDDDRGSGWAAVAKCADDFAADAQGRAWETGKANFGALCPIKLTQNIFIFYFLKF